MKAAIVLLLDYPVHNFVRKLALEVQQKYQIDPQINPPHVSLKQPFEISDLSALEIYFDQFAASIEPFELSLPRIDGPEDGPVLWLEAEETETLRNLHIRLNQELAERFANTQAPFDGPEYHFHATVAIGGQSTEVYRAMVAEFASREVGLRTMARSLAMFYYAENQDGSGYFLTYKILPPGQEK
jgi:2'-5' RNA ligase